MARYSVPIRAQQIGLQHREDFFALNGLRTGDTIMETGEYSETSKGKGKGRWEAKIGINGITLKVFTVMNHTFGYITKFGRLYSGLRCSPVSCSQISH